MSPSIPSSVPSQIANRLAWDIVKIKTNLSLSAGASEVNYNFSLSQHPQVGSWSALYDQWCIPQASITWYSSQPMGSTLTCPDLHTAIDFDNSSPLGSVQLIDNYDNARVDVLVPQRKFTRSVKPCVKLTANSGGNTLARQWCDSGSPAILWYGIRSILNVTAAIPNGQFFSEITVWYVFRNRI
jgi:hypothetical protein